MELQEQSVPILSPPRTWVRPAVRALRPERPRRGAKVAFAILTHGALEATQRCLRSLLATTPLDHEVFVLDNASRDDTVAWLAAIEVEHIHPFASPTNLGVAGGRNALLRIVRPELPADGWVVFADNDLEFEPGWTEPFVELLRQRDDVGIAGVVGHYVVVGEDGRTLLPAPVRTMPVDVVSGGFACWVRASVVDAIGGFDERTNPFWHEDDDLCVRAVAHGFEVFAVPEAAVRHDPHQSGVALPDLDHGGSPTNQSYLARKWRAAGWIDTEGWLVRPGGRESWTPAQREELRRRAGWTRPIGRVELAHAAWDVDRLGRADDPAAEAAARPIARTPLHDAILETRRLEAGAGEHAALQRAATVLQQGSAGALLGEHLTVPVRTTRAGSPCKPCDLGDWDDDRWFALAEQVLARPIWRDVPERHRASWEQVEVARALHELGVLRPDAVGLSVGAGREPLLWYVPHHARMLVAIDLYDHRAEQELGVPSDLPKHPARYALRPVPGERLAVLAQDARLLELGDASFDFAYSIGCLHDCGGYADAVRVLKEMARVVKPGGVVVIATDLIVDGGHCESAFTAEDLGGALFEDTGLELVAPFDQALPLLTAEGSRLDGGVMQPHGIGQSGGARVTSAVVVLRVQREAPRAPASPRPATRTIAVDARTLDYGNSTSRGIGHYTCHHLEAVARARPDWQLVCHGSDVVPRALRPLLALPNVRHVMRSAFDPRRCDLVHVPDPMNLSRGFDAPLAVFGGAPATVTFHDLTPLRCYWQAYARDDRALYLDRLRQLRDSDAILLTNSDFTRRDLLAALRLPPERAVTILAGLNHHPLPQEETVAAARRARRWHQDQPFFLHVGALDMHKNFDGVLDAFGQLVAERPARLVVVGPRDGGWRHFERRCEQEGLAGVVWAGFLPRPELEALYAAAAGLVFLSFYEGFGFPALEAMARGCPVVASSSSSLPEVVGDAGLLVHPRDRDGAVRAMRALLEQNDLRDELGRRGRARAEAFTWQGAAERTIAVWEQVLASSRR